MFYTTPTHNSQFLFICSFRRSVCILVCICMARVTDSLHFLDAPAIRYFLFLLLLPIFFFVAFVARFSTEIRCVYSVKYHAANTIYIIPSEVEVEEEKKKRRQLEVPHATPTAKRTQSSMKLSAVAAACRARQQNVFLTKFRLLCNLC